MKYTMVITVSTLLIIIIGQVYYGIYRKYFHNNTKKKIINFNFGRLVLVIALYIQHQEILCL